MIRISFAVLALALCGCGRAHMNPSTVDGSTHTADDAPVTSDGGACDTSSLGAPDTRYVLAPAFADDYATYALGALFSTQLIEGLAFSAADSDHMLVTNHERIYSVTLRREACGHIIGFSGSPALVAGDGVQIQFGSLAVGANGLVFATYDTQGVAVGLAELPAGQATDVYRVDLGGLGLPAPVSSELPSLGFAPGQEPRSLVLADAAGAWYSASYVPQQSWFAVTNVSRTAALSPQYGFGYVPPGSPGFAQPSMLVGEAGTVNAYALDATATPIPATREPFYSTFGGYAMRAEAFDPKTGDLLFASVMNDGIFVVHGFAPIL